MATTIQEVLGFQNLTGIIQDPRGGIPADVLPEGFTSTTGARQVMGDHATYTKVSGTRETARLIQYGGPSVKRGRKDVADVPVKLIHTFEHQHHDAAVLQDLRNFDNPQVQQRGQAEVMRQVGEFGRLFNNLRIASVYSIFAQGHIYFDGDGNLLPSSSGNVVDVDFGVPAGHLNQLDIEGSGNIIGASWATSTTSIATHVQNIVDAIERVSGYRIRHCFYGKNIFSYLLANDEVQEMLKSDQALAAAFRQRQIPNGFLELDWHRATRAFFTDPTGTNQTFFGADTVAFVPDPSPEWWEWILGSYAVPTTLGEVFDDAMAANTGGLATVFGRYSYSRITDDPPGIKHLAGDTFLPVLKVPRSIAIADVTP